MLLQADLFNANVLLDHPIPAACPWLQYIHPQNHTLMRNSYSAFEASRIGWSRRSNLWVGRNATVYRRGVCNILILFRVQ